MDQEENTAVEITPAVQKFLRDHIQSLWQLELILLLREKHSPHSAAEIAANLYSNSRVIEGALTSFVQSGILSCNDEQPARYAYEPHSAEVKAAIDQSYIAYTNKRLAVINFIFSQSEKKGA